MASILSRGIVSRVKGQGEKDMEKEDSKDQENLVEESKRKNGNVSSDDSDWSEIATPGKSHLDEMISRRNRFNLHYHKQGIVKIPQRNRIPLLPNEENYDWIQERKLITIERRFPTQNMPTKKRILEKLELELDRKVPLVEELEREWNRLSVDEREERTKNDSLQLLFSAKKIKKRGEVVDKYFLPKTPVRMHNDCVKSESLAGQTLADKLADDELIDLNEKSHQKCHKKVINKQSSIQNNEIYYGESQTESHP